MFRPLVTTLTLACFSLGAFAATFADMVTNGVDLDLVVTGGDYEVTGAFTSSGALDPSPMGRVRKPITTLNGRLALGTFFSQFGVNESVEVNGTKTGPDTINWDVVAPELAGKQVTVTINNIPVNVTLDAVEPVKGLIQTTVTPAVPYSFSDVAGVFRIVDVGLTSGTTVSVKIKGTTILGAVQLDLRPTLSGHAGNLPLPSFVSLVQNPAPNLFGYWWTNGNGSITSYQGLGKLPAGWNLVGFADADKDADDDIALYNPTTRRLAFWLTTNGMISGWRTMVGLFVDSPVAVGDLNNDGYADVLVRTPSGMLGTYYLNGTGIAGWRRFFSGGSPEVVGIADMDRDNSQDIVVKYGANSVGAYLVEDEVITGWKSMMALPAGYEPVGLGEFDANHFNDLLVRNTATNVHSVYRFEKTMQVGWKPFSGVAPTWHCGGVAHF